MHGYRYVALTLEEALRWADVTIATGADPRWVLDRFSYLVWQLAGVARMLHDLEPRV